MNKSFILLLFIVFYCYNISCLLPKAEELQNFIQNEELRLKELQGNMNNFLTRLKEIREERLYKEEAAKRKGQKNSITLQFGFPVEDDNELSHKESSINNEPSTTIPLVVLKGDADTKRLAAVRRTSEDEKLKELLEQKKMESLESLKANSNAELTDRISKVEALIVNLERQKEYFETDKALVEQRTS